MKFLKEILEDNPVFSLYLGLCSTLAISTNINNALGMGLCVVSILCLSNLIISAIRKVIPSTIRIPVYIVIIATLVKSLELLIHAFVPSLYTALGTFLPLIVVNCIVLGRAEAFASKNTPLASLYDGFKMGCGYTLSLFSISIIRQIIGTGVLQLYNPLTTATLLSIRLIPDQYTISVFSQSTGAFITFALVASLLWMFQHRKEEKA